MNGRRFGSRGMLHSFARGERAAAAVEFALVMPLLLTLYLGSIEISELFIADRRVATISATVGDLVARKNGLITKNEVAQYFEAAEVIMQPFSEDSVRQVVTLVAVDNAGVAKVRWSQSAPTGTPKMSPGQVFDLSGSSNMVSLAKGKFLVVSETSYSHAPMTSFFVTAAVPLYSQNVYFPRYANEIKCPTC